jgi:damage-control phosphatase, subfamily III
MHSFFLLSQHWKTYDIFARQKIDGFRNSRVGVLELAARYRELVQQIRANKELDEDAEKILFAEMFDICLWGNATDLSLLTTLTRDDIQRLQGAQARKNAEKNILANDVPAAYDLLRNIRASGEKGRRVDFVLDNAGFELFADLILAGYLLTSGLATHIVLHPKSIPWFVSDVMPADFAALLQTMADPQGFFGSSEDGKITDKQIEDVKFLFQEWATFHSEGQLVIRPNRYWTAGGSFWRLPYEAKQLYEDLKESKLVIFKGDLNYRKLTADVSILSNLFFRHA